ncbi:hypothetical protein AVEN_264583-1 [Araneus ventricosus]|uniref:MADF domain-containing protein n=1 Tax=Araneus ventricosus TaxID=182803 RepID=A0A4Y2D6Z7_ARAVE|nr:hypothetical protein AVEN_264583-1 [Araneus ventricosus]
MILEVEKYPYLYDSRHNDFKNRELKKDAWMAVTKNVIGEKWDQMDEKTRSNVVERYVSSSEASAHDSLRNVAGNFIG